MNAELLKKIAVPVTAAVIGFGITFPITTWFNRAKPTISLLSVGFRSPAGAALIPVEQRLVDLSSLSLAAESLKRFETFDNLLKVETQVSETSASLRQAKESIEGWLSQNATRVEDSERPQQLTRSAMSSHPFAADELVRVFLYYLVRQGELNSPPIKLDRLKKLRPTLPFGHLERSDTWVLIFGLISTKMKMEDFPPESRKAMEALAHSLGTGCLENVRYYSNEFIDAANREIALDEEIRTLLHRLLLPNATLSAKISVENRGGRSVTISPYFLMRFSVDGASNEPVYLRAQAYSTDSTLERETRGTSGVEGKRVQVTPFLPDPNAFPYINVPAGEIREVLAVGVNTLGGSTESILGLYRSKAIRAALVGSTVAGKVLETEFVSFSESIEEEDKKRLALPEAG